MVRKKGRQKYAVKEWKEGGLLCDVTSFMFIVDWHLCVCCLYSTFLLIALGMLVSLSL